MPDDTFVPSLDDKWINTTDDLWLGPEDLAGVAISISLALSASFDVLPECAGVGISKSQTAVNFDVLPECAGTAISKTLATAPDPDTMRDLAGSCASKTVFRPCELELPIHLFVPTVDDHWVDTADDQWWGGGDILSASVSAKTWTGNTFERIPGLSSGVEGKTRTGTPVLGTEGFVDTTDDHWVDSEDDHWGGAVETTFDSAVSSKTVASATLYRVKIRGSTITYKSETGAGTLEYAEGLVAGRGISKTRTSVLLGRIQPMSGVAISKTQSSPLLGNVRKGSGVAISKTQISAAAYSAIINSGIAISKTRASSGLLVSQTISGSAIARTRTWGEVTTATGTLENLSSTGISRTRTAANLIREIGVGDLVSRISTKTKTSASVVCNRTLVSQSASKTGAVAPLAVDRPISSSVRSKSVTGYDIDLLDYYVISYVEGVAISKSRTGVRVRIRLNALGLISDPSIHSQTTKRSLESETTLRQVVNY